MPVKNIDQQIVDGVGAERKRFNQNVPSNDHVEDSERHFYIFSWEALPQQAVGRKSAAADGSLRPDTRGSA